jgi:hypothetical protein
MYFINNILSGSNGWHLKLNKVAQRKVGRIYVEN